MAPAVFCPSSPLQGKQKDKAKTSFLVVSNLYCLYLTLGNSPPYGGVFRWFSMEWFGYAGVHLILHFGLFWVFFPFRILQDIFGKQHLEHLFLRLVWVSALPWSYFTLAYSRPCEQHTTWKRIYKRRVGLKECIIYSTNTNKGNNMLWDRR